MKLISTLIILLFIISCGKDKVVQLPEINHSDISEIQDVSAAYLFYDESHAEGYELNRKNLISTTNWLVNVDKRLTLKQVIPQVKFLQDKKQNSEHKNKNAKNYFTCNNLSKQNLGFIEFTDVIYCMSEPELFFEVSDIPIFSYIQIEFNSKEKINLTLISDKRIQKTSNQTNLINDLTNLLENENAPLEIILAFKENLSFGDYISFKSLMSSYKNNSTFIMLNEFIY